MLSRKQSILILQNMTLQQIFTSCQECYWIFITIHKYNPDSCMERYPQASINKEKDNEITALQHRVAILDTQLSLQMRWSF